MRTMEKTMGRGREERGVRKVQVEVRYGLLKRVQVRRARKLQTIFLTL